MSASSVAPPPSSSSSNPSDQLHTTTISAEDQADLDLRSRKRQDYEKFKHYAAMGTILLAPTLMLMPPRKLDLYTVALAGGFVASASQLSKERYGAGLIDMVGRKLVLEQQPKQEMVKRDQKEEWQWSSSIPTEKAQELKRQIQQSKGGETSDSQGLLKRLWMGGEKENWKEQRAKEHAEALERGETIGDLIRAQISEAWNWGEKKAEDLEQKDREVLSAREKDK